MSKFNKYLESKFHGCHVLNHRDDPGRSRRIIVYGMPEDYEHVGLFDGVDAWVTDARGDDLKMLQEIQAGQPREIEYGQHRKRFADGEYTYGTEAARNVAVSNPHRRERRTADPQLPLELPARRERKVVGRITEVGLGADGMPVVLRRERRVV